MKGTCSICKQHKTVHKNRKTGKLICHACYKREIYEQPKEQCSICHKVKPVGCRIENGQPVCPACYRREINVAKCSICHKVKPVACRTEDSQPVCQACYQREFYKPPKEQCSICNKVKPVNYRLFVRFVIGEVKLAYVLSAARQRLFRQKNYAMPAISVNGEGKVTNSIQEAFGRSFLIP